MSRDRYKTPLERYAGGEMSHVFSEEFKFRTWRKCWIALAESEKELGLNITDEQIDEMKRFQNEVNYEDAEKNEKEIRHDVLSHIHAYGIQCPSAKPIIHLGATSCYVTDNTELIQMREGLKIIRNKLVNSIDLLGKFALKYKYLETLAFTHYQPASPTTVGKRATLWAYDLLLDLDDAECRIDNFKGAGVKGATGTQASFLELFDGNPEKVRELEQKVSRKLGFNAFFKVSGQTYTRKFDYQIMSVLAGISSSAHKFATDSRLLQNRQEFEEPFETKQKGSSAMPYKRNPMKAERICSLARHVQALLQESLATHSVQWFERTLDDSAGRRIYIPESFLATDGILNLYMNIMENPNVYPKVIGRNLEQELPFMLAENILMKAVKKGGDRQELHTLIRDHAMEVNRRVKGEGKENDLLDRLAKDPKFPLGEDEIRNVKEKRLSGMASMQVVDFYNDMISPKLAGYSDVLGRKSEVKV